MANYFDNQTNWSWNVSDGKATVTTHHSKPKAHSHTMDVTNVPIGEMNDNPGKVMGELHRSVSHDYEDQNMSKNDKNNVKDEGKGRDDDFGGRYSREDSLKTNNKQNKTAQNPEGVYICEQTFPYRVIGRRADKTDNNSKNSKVVSQMRSEMKTVTPNESKTTNNSQNITSGKLSTNGQAVDGSGKTASPSISGGKNASTGHSSGGKGGSSNGGQSSGAGHGAGGHGGGGGHGGSGGHGGH